MKNFFLRHHSEKKEADDIQALSRIFQLPQFTYVDILQQQNLSQIMERWPLLSELAQKPISENENSQ